MKLTSFTTLQCEHVGCSSRLTLETVLELGKGPARTHKDTHEALQQAAVALSWRRNITTQRTLCGVHAAGLLCARCGFEQCSCMGGPRMEAVSP